MKPDAATAAVILSNCFCAVCASPESWRTFEHEQQAKPNGETETFDDWALRKAGVRAKIIWERSVKAAK